MIRPCEEIPPTYRELTRGLLGRLKTQTLEDLTALYGNLGRVAGLELERRLELDIDCEACGDTRLVLHGDFEVPCGGCEDRSGP